MDRYGWHSARKGDIQGHVAVDRSYDDYCGIRHRFRYFFRRAVPEYGSAQGGHVSKPMDKRRFVISAFLLATLLLGFGLQKLGTYGPKAESVVVDPHVASGDLSGESRMVHQQFQQAVALLQQGQFEFAVQGFHEVLKVVPDLPEAHVNMGFALIGLEKFEVAQAFFDSASNIRPSQSNAYYGLAVAQEGLGDLQQAVATMRTFVHIAEQDDPYRRKAESAIWEWEVALAAQEDDE